eukprot:3350781-Prymnesium_polylepis.1
MPQVAGLGAALTFAKEQGIRCIAVTNAPRAAGECALASLKASIDAAGARRSCASVCARSATRPFPVHTLTTVRLTPRHASTHPRFRAPTHSRTHASHASHAPTLPTLHAFT